MEYRKIIKFGKNSHIISLPKNWLEKHNLNKGDLVYLDEGIKGIVIYPKEIKEDEKPTSITIDVTGKDRDDIVREISASYINNFNLINITGKDLNKKIPLIKKIIHNLMALEIVEQTPSRIVAKDFLNIKEVSIDELIRKIDVIIRTMIIDSKSTPKKDLYEEIYNRDEDVNRLTFLAYRIIKKALKRPALFKIRPTKLLSLWLLALYLEMIADESKRIARYLRELKIDNKLINELISIYSKIEKNYLTTMKAYYNKDKNLAYNQSTMKKVIVKECDKIYNKTWNNKQIPILLEKFKNMAFAIHEIGRLIYQ